MNKKVDCLNKRDDFKRTEQVILADENIGAVEMWNAFVEVAESLSCFEDLGCDIGRCYKALSIILHKVNEPVNKRLIAEWLDAGKFEYKGLEDTKPLGGLIGKLREAIEEQDEAILNPKWLTPPINEEPDLGDDDYAEGGRYADLSIKD